MHHRCFLITALSLLVSTAMAEPPDVAGYAGGLGFIEIQSSNDRYPGTQLNFTGLGLPKSKHGLTAYAASNGTTGGLLGYGEACFGNQLTNVIYDSSDPLPGQVFGAENIRDFEIFSPDGNTRVAYIASGNGGNFFGTYVFDCKTKETVTIQDTGSALPDIEGVQTPLAFATIRLDVNDRQIAQIWSYVSPSGNSTMLVRYTVDGTNVAAEFLQNAEAILVAGQVIDLATEPGGDPVPQTITSINQTQISPNRFIADVNTEIDGTAAGWTVFDPITGERLFGEGDVLESENDVLVNRSLLHLEDCGLGGVFEGDLDGYLLIGNNNEPDGAFLPPALRRSATIDGLPIQVIGDVSVTCDPELTVAANVQTNDNAWRPANFTRRDADPFWNINVIDRPPGLIGDFFGGPTNRTGQPYINVTPGENRVFLNDNISPRIYRRGIRLGWKQQRVNGPEEVLTFLQNANQSISVTASDPSNGALVSNLPFLNPDFSAVSTFPVRDLGTNGAVGVFATRRSDNLPIIQFKDVVTGALVSNVFPFSGAWTVVAAEIIVSEPSGPIFAVLASRDSDGLMAVQLRNPADGSFIRNIFPLGFGWTPLSIGVIENANGGPAIAVLAKRASDDLTIVQVRSIADGSLIRNVYHLGLGWTPLEMLVVPDLNGNGIDDIAVRMVRDEDSLEVVQVRDSDTQDFIINHFPLDPDFDTLAMDNVDVNGTPALAILYTQVSTGQMLVQLRDLATRNLIKNTFFLGPPWGADAFTALPDLDSNGVDEITVLTTNPTTGAQLFQTRDASTGELIRNIPVGQ